MSPHPTGIIARTACRFFDRATAGRELARHVAALSFSSTPLVLGLPRGGVPVAEEVARSLRCPLDVLVVRKIGSPMQPELAIGAIASGNVVLREPGLPSFMRTSDDQFARIVEHERVELARREQRYRQRLGAPLMTGRDVVLVDDGIATGATMLAAVQAARAGEALSVTVAAPVASTEAVERLRAVADRVLVLQVPSLFQAVGEWYEQFPQTSDEQVLDCLRRAWQRH
jgi:putative phosphoribosyl transferase